MTLYIAVNLKDGEIVLVTDDKVSAEQAIPNNRKDSGEYQVWSTRNIVLSSAAQAEMSMFYEEDCVKESVCTVLRERGVDEDTHPAEFEQLAAAIAADAYRDMLKYDVDEEYAISEAMKKHETEIATLL